MGARANGPARSITARGLRLSLADPAGAALGPRTTGELRTTAANDGQPTVLVSSHFRAFAQVTQ
jgi:hypothetical protein